MKVYVDELPKSCEECPMCRSGKLKLQRKGRYVEVEQCVFGQYKYQTIDDEIDTCPLQTITDHEKQVRKQVCDEIKEFLENHKYKVLGDYNHQTLQYNETYICELLEINKFLDQIEKGE